MSVHLSDRHFKIAEEQVARARQNGGLAPLDLERFWHDQSVSSAAPWGRDIPQLPFGALCNWECVFAELGIDQDWWRWDHDHAWRLEVTQAYNEKAEQIVGHRLIPESVVPGGGLAQPRSLWELFEMKNIWDAGSQSWWLTESAQAPDELAALLDRVEQRLENPRSAFLPEDWEEVKSAYVRSGTPLPGYQGQRGPVTLATSCYGVEALIYLALDNEPLFLRFRDLILKAMTEKILLHWEEAGRTQETAPRGFSFCDDNCAMLNTELYEAFGYPILKGIFELTSPDPADNRFQHSDSDMGHLLPILGRLNLTGANFGPNVRVDDIRRHLPRAVIYGALAPFTYSRNEGVNMVAELMRDYELIGDTRGLVFSCAGSINNGSLLSGMRLLMATIQQRCRY